MPGSAREAETMPPTLRRCHRAPLLSRERHYCRGLSALNTAIVPEEAETNCLQPFGRPATSEAGQCEEISDTIADNCSTTARDLEGRRRNGEQRETPNAPPRLGQLVGKHAHKIAPGHRRRASHGPPLMTATWPTVINSLVPRH